MAALLLPGVRADAYCRAVTASPPAGYDPSKTGCFGFTDGGVTPGMFPLFWRNACVSYSFQPTASKYIPLADAKRVGADAFGAWSGASCTGGAPSITAVNFPEVDCDEAPSTEHSNVIIFRDQAWPYDDSANAIGYTTLTVDLSSGEILGAITEINSAQWVIVAEPPAPANAYDFATIMTHEAGHFLGLAHTADTTAVMYALYHAGTALQADDVSGICSIYRPDGTHDTALGPFAAESCDPRPLQGFLPTSCGSFDAGTVDLMSIGSGAGVSTTGLSVACPPDQSGCTAGGAAPPWGVGLGAAGLFGVAAVARVARRKSRRNRTAAVLGLALAAGGAGFLGEHVAQASVSAAAVFDDLVRQSSAVAVVTPIEQHAAWEGPRIVTTTRVRVDRLIAGEAPGELSVRTQGGSVGHIGQILEGQPIFTLGAPSLLFLRSHVDANGAASDVFTVTASAQGQFPIASGPGTGARLQTAPNVGALVEPPSKPAGARFAKDVLEGHGLDEAARAIAETFRRVHT